MEVHHKVFEATSDAGMRYATGLHKYFTVPRVQFQLRNTKELGLQQDRQKEVLVQEVYNSFVESTTTRYSDSFSMLSDRFS